MLVAVLGERDAVGTDAREMAAALVRQGHEVRLFASATQGESPAAEPLEAIDGVIRDPDAVLIYHFAFGWPPGVEILQRARCRRIVRYHNVTPPEFFAGWSLEYETSCRAGREEIATLAALDCELYLGASPFNVTDFLAVGVAAERCAVLPPFNRLDRLIESPSDLRVLDEICDGSANWLVVGRLAPNKGHLALFDAFATYVDRCEANARLLVVGSEDPRLASYNAALRDKLASLHLESHVRFLRDVDDSVLKAAYLGADALISLSGHEGFCVPLAEAMALGVPVVALDCTAQGWTVGNAGLLWSSADPALIAASVERLRQDAALRDVLRQRGFERVAAAFSPSVLESQLATVLEALR
ncbi:MAG: glycosyltransferase family 4 protein [Dokdonella sp.]